MTETLRQSSRRPRGTPASRPIIAICGHVPSIISGPSQPPAQGTVASAPSLGLVRPSLGVTSQPAILSVQGTTPRSALSQEGSPQTTPKPLPSAPPPTPGGLERPLKPSPPREGGLRHPASTQPGRWGPWGASVPSHRLVPPEASPPRPHCLTEVRGSLTGGLRWAWAGQENRCRSPTWTHPGTYLVQGLRAAAPRPDRPDLRGRQGLLARGCGKGGGCEPGQRQALTFVEG